MLVEEPYRGHWLLEQQLRQRVVAALQTAESESHGWMNDLAQVTSPPLHQKGCFKALVLVAQDMTVSHIH
jgi:hypothetical protein